MSEKSFVLLERIELMSDLLIGRTLGREADVYIDIIQEAVQTIRALEENETDV
ncbi:hypothetical protein [Neobittarella massiliensis]|uniref:Uncharacterized protein n=2 Tax=Oscillospiraceae TaxID=216572 RepID=A0A8J6IR77_9FIRM|nr:hypothetical protein [Neobittarella massiliensis]MBC3517191.1 hypothetical protein [Neobittarella massiliensis]SCJ34604.1 Uncharacterised protein [uncultured Anaerotruncus sp.]